MRFKKYLQARRAERQGHASDAPSMLTKNGGSGGSVPLQGYARACVRVCARAGPAAGCAPEGHTQLHATPPVQGRVVHTASGWHQHIG